MEPLRSILEEELGGLPSKEYKEEGKDDRDDTNVMCHPAYSLANSAHWLPVLVAKNWLVVLFLVRGKQARPFAHFNGLLFC